MSQASDAASSAKTPSQSGPVTVAELAEVELASELSGAAARLKLRDTIGGAQALVITTAGADGLLRSRPLTLLQLDDDARLWFFVDCRSDWVAELAEGSAVNASISDERSASWISIAGRASVVRDPARNDRLWNGWAAKHFATPADTELALLCIDAETVDTWNGQGSAVSRLVGLAKRALTGGTGAIPQQHESMLVSPAGDDAPFVPE
jgi:general stress protein 26